MGRQSPGKWIKNLLLGKKKSSSKSKSSSKEKDIYKPSSKDVMVVSSEPSMSSTTVISPTTYGTNATKGVLSEKEVISISSNNGPILSARDKQSNEQSLVNFGSGDHHEKIKLTEAAITVQAAIRGYQVLRKIKTVKGIIPLQAYIRSQLVRRQAISALNCVKAIVKFQALARGYKVRHSGIGLAAQKILKDTKFLNSFGEVTSTQAANLSDNTFVWKLLDSTPSAVSLYLKYNPGDPNLSWEWLDRWTKSRIWAPLRELKKPDSMSEKKTKTSPTVETNNKQVERNARKSPAVRIGDNAVSDSNKHKQYPKKDSNSKVPLQSPKGHPQKKNVKGSSKKAQIQNVIDKSDLSIEETTHIVIKVSDHAVNDVPEQDLGTFSEKTKDSAVSNSNSKQSDHEKSLAQQAEEHADESCNDTNNFLQSSFISGKGDIEDLNWNVDESFISNVNSKNSQRRASLPANFIDHENLLHSNPRLPSYMAPTESTKAKLRGLGSPRLSNDLMDQNSMNRRLSVSSSLNGKLSSFSPRADRSAALSGKGMIRTDRCLSSSRDGTDKLIQPQWRR